MRTLRHLLRRHSARTPRAARARLMRPAVDLVAAGALESALRPVNEGETRPSGSMLAVRMARTIREYPDDFARWYDEHRDDAAVRPDIRDALYHRPVRKRRKILMNPEEMRYHVRTYWPYYLALTCVIIGLAFGFGWTHVTSGP